jgi:hypothetical protein
MKCLASFARCVAYAHARARRDRRGVGAGGPQGRSSLAVGISAAADNGDRLDQPTKYEVVR